MAEVTLTNGMVTLVDNEDLHLLAPYTWVAVQLGNTWYAKAYTPAALGGKNGKPEIYLHRLVLGLAKGDGIKADHKNGNGLDNRKENLRIATKIQNQWNIQKRADGVASKYKGVSKTPRGSWQAAITVSKRRMYLGTFTSEIEAAQAYDNAAIEHFGEFARPNFISINKPALKAGRKDLGPAHLFCMCDLHGRCSRIIPASAYLCGYCQAHCDCSVKRIL